MAFAIVSCAALFAAACTSRPSNAGPDGSVTTSIATTAELTTSAPKVPVPSDDERGSATSSSGPDRGGRLVYGVEAESANPWAPYRTSCGTSCLVVLQAVSDPLFVQTVDGGIEGMLVEAVEVNDDSTEHTWTIRSGVSFHDGSSLTGAAVAFNIDSCRFSSLTGSKFTGIVDVEPDGQSVTITTDSPWVPLPAHFAGTACSFMFSPDWLASLADVPFRDVDAHYFSEVVAAESASGDPAAPVGVGPFQFESFVPGNGNSFIASRYDAYWRGPTGQTGEQLPYLDAIEIIVVADPAARSALVKNGTVGIMHTSSASEIAGLRQSNELELVESAAYADTSYIVLNVAAGTNSTIGVIEQSEAVPMDPLGSNADNPMIHQSCRRAFAHATDTAEIAARQGAGVTRPANGPFPPGSIGHLKDSDYPVYSREAAAIAFDACLNDAQVEVVDFTLATSSDQPSLELAQAVAANWIDVFGDEIQVIVEPLPVGEFGRNALVGAFDAQIWRNHAGSDPDEQFTWWYSGAATPLGSLGLNIGRFQDSLIDQNLVVQRQVADPELRLAAAEEINRAFGENVWNLWLTWGTWAIAHDERVQGLTDGVAIDGTSLEPLAAGLHPIAQLWCSDGRCDNN